MQWIISSIDICQTNSTILICQINLFYLPTVSRQAKATQHTLNPNTQLHYSIYSPPTHTYNAYSHKYHSPYKAFTYKNYKPNHWHTPTNGTIRTCTTILSHSPWFQERLNEYTTRQTPTHNLRHWHTSQKTGFWWSMLGILLCGSWRRLWKSERIVMHSYYLLWEP